LEIAVETLPNQMPGQYVSPGGFEAAPESKFDFWGVLNRRKWIVFLGMLTGIGIGFLYHLYTPVVYQSEAVIRISPKSPNYIRLSRLSSEAVAPDVEQILPTRHDKVINQPLIIKKCFDANELYRLESFQEMKPEDVVKMVCKTLEVTPDKEDDFNYKMSFECKNPTDAKTVLSNVIKTYETYRFAEDDEAPI
jgi:succinoglycan biosynthesis transport protein ExoP